MFSYVFSLFAVIYVLCGMILNHVDDISWVYTRWWWCFWLDEYYVAYSMQWDERQSSEKQVVLLIGYSQSSRQVAPTTCLPSKPIRGVCEFVCRENPSDRTEIDTWFEYSGSSWCCVQPPYNTSIGHVHYDLLPERTGTIDRHGFRRTDIVAINLGP